MTFLVLVHTYKDFAQALKNFAQFHDCTTITFRSSGLVWVIQCSAPTSMTTTIHLGCQEKCAASQRCWGRG